MQKPSVFISSSVAGLNAARELARQIESFATVTVWSEGAFEPGKTICESLTEVADRSDFAVFLLTANDVVHSRGFSRRIPRDNVLFELGFLAGRLGINRTFIVSEHNADPRLPSDIAGVAYLKFKATQQKDFSVALAPVATANRRTIQKSEPRVQKPVDYHSCFISYSWRDKDFATQLHDDPREVGVRCWLDAKDISPGAVITDEIDKAIQAHDKRSSGQVPLSGIGPNRRDTFDVCPEICLCQMEKSRYTKLPNTHQCSPRRPGRKPPCRWLIYSKCGQAKRQVGPVGLPSCHPLL